MAAMEQRTVHIPAARLPRWVSGFGERHGGSSETLHDGLLHLTGADGARATLTAAHDISATTASEFVIAATVIPRTAVILVRRGGFAAAVVEGHDVVAADAGRRHVQGRTAAGGWSQQRFARRRDKQVNELVDAATEYAVRIILPALPVQRLATGGDRPLLDDVLRDPRLRSVAALPRGPHLAISDPRKATVTELPALLSSVRIDLVDPAPQ